MQRSLAVALTAGSILWLAILLAAPPALVGGGPWLSAPAAIVYTLGSRICHQRPERSFHAAGVQLPVCARCFGLYGSGAAGAAAFFVVWAIRRRPCGPDRDGRMLLAIAAVPTAVTLAVEAAGVAYPSNLTRAASALPLGAAAGWLFVRLLWCERDARGAASVRAGA